MAQRVSRETHSGAGGASHRGRGVQGWSLAFLKVRFLLGVWEGNSSDLVRSLLYRRTADPSQNSSSAAGRCISERGGAELISPATFLAIDQCACISARAPRERRFNVVHVPKAFGRLRHQRLLQGSLKRRKFYNACTYIPLTNQQRYLMFSEL